MTLCVPRFIYFPLLPLLIEPILSLIDRIRVQSIAIAKSDNLKSYTGGVFLTKPKEIDMSKEDRPLSLSVLCESNQPTKTPPPPIKTTDGEPPKCPTGYSEISKY